MTNTPLTVTDASGATITVLSDDYGLGFGNAAGTSTQLVGIDNSDVVTFQAAISTLPTGDFLFVTSSIKQDRFTAGQAIAINKDLFKRCIANTSGSTIVFKRIYGSLKVNESKANIDAQLVDSSGGSGTFNALSGEATSTATGGATTLTNSAVIGKVITGFTSGAGTVAATDTILQAIQKLNGNDGLKATDSAVVHLAGAESITGAKTFSTQPLGIVGASIGNTAAGNIAATNVQAAINELDSEKQALLVSATNIKTINGSSILGSGDLTISSGSSLTTTTVGTAIFQYEILTGTPVIGYTKTGGAGNGVMTCTGGTIKLRQFTDDIVAADLASTAIRFDFVGTGTVIKLARSFIPTKYLLNATDALADASTNASTSNQVDVDNTPPVKYGNIVTTGFGSMSIRLDNVTTDIGINFRW